MSSMLTKNFGVLNALNFERLVTGTFANTYIAIGRSVPWPGNGSPTIPVDTANTFYDTWNHLVGLKRITSADMNLVVPRVDWTSNTVYTEYTQDTQLFVKTSESAINYANSFYVRNTQDQVFKCLFNSSSANSTVMPEITIGGQLPENPFVETSDGYRWKYLYTIPSGLKEKFFTSQYMPITTEDVVQDYAVDGRIDIVKIVVAGAGYNANGNSNSYPIVSVSGDGSNANITVKVSSTAANGANIVGYTIINGGNNYTRALLTLTDPLKIQGTANANLVAIISPPGGHGSDVAQELGASNLMISIGFEGDESGNLPVSDIEPGGFRQIAIIKDPLLANSSFATGSVYRATTKYLLTQPNKDFQHGETVYVGTSLASASFTGTVEHYDDASYRLYLNNLVGTVTAPATVVGSQSGAIATIISIDEPLVKKYSGDLLYLDNLPLVTRSLTETQQLKLTLRF